MRVDSQKPLSLVLALALIAAACSSSESQSGKQPAAKSPAVTTPTVLPERITTPPRPIPELLTPRSLEEGTAFLMYPQGAVVNLTRGINLNIDLNNLQQVNTNPVYGINLTNQDQNITYLFPQSFISGNGREEAIRIAEEELPKVISILHINYGINRGRIRYSLISVADVLTYIAKSNPNVPVNSDIYKILSGFELSGAYLNLTRLAIFDSTQTPITYPVSTIDRAPLAQRLSYPFSIQVIDPNYLTVLGLSRAY